MTTTVPMLGAGPALDDCVPYELRSPEGTVLGTGRGTLTEGVEVVIVTSGVMRCVHLRGAHVADFAAVARLTVRPGDRVTIRLNAAVPPEWT